MGRGYMHLSEEERQVIQIRCGQGFSIRAIGRELGRAPSTISREIKRNTWFPSNESEAYRPYKPSRLKTGPWTGQYYLAGPAQKKAIARAKKARKDYRIHNDRLHAWVCEGLRRGWSPLLISGRMKLVFPHDRHMRICPETIYAWIYSTKQRAEQWAPYLPRAHRQRRKRNGRARARVVLAGRVSISQRPAHVEDRQEFGHWEGDSLICVGGNLHTQTERKTRFLIAVKVKDKTK